MCSESHAILNNHSMKKIIGFFVLINLLASVNAQKKINVRDFGAKGNGKSDDTRAIQAAINAAPSSNKTIIYFPAGIYKVASYTTTKNYLENYSLLLHSNLSFKGDGKNSIIKVGDHIFDKEDSNANAHLFYGRHVNNVSFSFLTIDLNGSRNLNPPKAKKNHSALFLVNGTNCSLNNVAVKNCSGNDMLLIMGNGNKLLISNCQFLNGGRYVGTKTPNSNSYDFSFVYSEWDSTIFEKNLVKQQNIDIGLSNNCGGLEIHGNNSIATSNDFIGCWPGIFISSQKDIPLHDVMIKDNQFNQCVDGIIFWLKEPINNITIKNNKIKLTASRDNRQNLSIGIEVPNGNAKEYSNRLANGSTITNLEVFNNIISGGPMQKLSAGFILHSLQKSKIFNNYIDSMTYGGIVLTGSKWGMDSLLVMDNTFKDFIPYDDKKTARGYIVITDTYSKNKPGASGFKDIMFAHNNFLRDNVNDVNESFSGAFIAVPANNLNEIKFIDNHYSIASEKKQVLIKY